MGDTIMAFLGTWSWWLLGIMQFAGLLLSALGTFGRGSKRDSVVLVGMVVTLSMLALSWFLHGLWGSVAAILVAQFLSRPVANVRVLRYLSSRGIVHSDPEVAMDIVRAEHLRERRQERFLRILGAKPWEAFDGRDQQQEVRDREAALSFLNRPDIAAMTRLDPENTNELVERIQVYLGPVQVRTIVRIAGRPEVLGAFSDYIASGGGSDTELYCAVLLGRR